MVHGCSVTEANMSILTAQKQFSSTFIGRLRHNLTQFFDNLVAADSITSER